MLTQLKKKFCHNHTTFYSSSHIISVPKLLEFSMLTACTSSPPIHPSAQDIQPISPFRLLLPGSQQLLYFWVWPISLAYHPRRSICLWSLGLLLLPAWILAESSWAHSSTSSPLLRHFPHPMSSRPAAADPPWPPGPKEGEAGGSGGPCQSVLQIRPLNLLPLLARQGQPPGLSVPRHIPHAAKTERRRPCGMSS